MTCHSGGMSHPSLKLTVDLEGGAAVFRRTASCVSPWEGSLLVSAPLLDYVYCSTIKL